MKKSTKLFSLLLVLIMAFVFPTAVLAGDKGNGSNSGKEKAAQTKNVKELKIRIQNEEKVALEEQKELLNEQIKAAEESGDTELAAQLQAQVAELEVQIEDLEAAEEEAVKPWVAAKKAVELEKNQLEVLKDAVEGQIDELEAQLEAAELSGDEALALSLKEQIGELKLEKNAYKIQMKEKITLMQQIMKEKYTQEELDQLAEISAQLAGEDITVIPVTNVFMENANIKFDVPPVIKEGRTLLPLRAISQATGAEVAWNADTKEVTVTKEGKEIIFSLTDGKVYVDGVETAIDVPGQSINNRTMVPMRFIVRQLGLEVQWDEDTQTIEIEDPEEEPVEDLEEEEPVEDPVDEPIDEPVDEPIDEPVSEQE